MRVMTAARADARHAEKTSRVDMELWDRDTFGRDDPLGLVGLHVKQVLELQKIHSISCGKLPLPQCFSCVDGWTK